MRDLETEIIAWFVAKCEVTAPAIVQQLKDASILKREFTSGAGAFLTLKPSASASQQKGSSLFAIDGPEVRSPEMSDGALVTLHVKQGVVSSFEIWSYAGDYPHNQHPKEFSLVESKMNYVGLHGEP